MQSKANKATTKATTTTPAPFGTTAKAPTKAPTVATVVAAPTMLPKGSGLCNGKGVALAVATTKGAAYTVPANGGNGVVHYVACHAAPTTAAAPQTWPGAYSGTTNATTGTVAGGPAGSNGRAYATHAVHVPASGPATWAVVHVYPGKAGTVVAARAHGNGTMVACQGGTGAFVAGTPCAATVALAATFGLVVLPC